MIINFSSVDNNTSGESNQSLGGPRVCHADSRRYCSVLRVTYVAHLTVDLWHNLVMLSLL